MSRVYWKSIKRNFMEGPDVILVTTWEPGPGTDIPVRYEDEPETPHPHSWEEYQPNQERDKEFYDIELMDGKMLFKCYPNAEHWNLLFRQGAAPIHDSQVRRIRRSHPDPFEMSTSFARARLGSAV